MAGKTKAQLRGQVVVLEKLLNEKTERIKTLCAHLDEQKGFTRCAMDNAAAAAASWKEDRKNLVADLMATKVVARTLAVGQWGDKTDENLNYAVYG